MVDICQCEHAAAGPGILVPDVESHRQVAGGMVARRHRGDQAASNHHTGEWVGVYEALARQPRDHVVWQYVGSLSKADLQRSPTQSRERNELEVIN